MQKLRAERTLFSTIQFLKPYQEATNPGVLAPQWIEFTWSLCAGTKLWEDWILQMDMTSKWRQCRVLFLKKTPTTLKLHQASKTLEYVVERWKINCLNLSRASSIGISLAAGLTQQVETHTLKRKGNREAFIIFTVSLGILRKLDWNWNWSKRRWCWNHHTTFWLKSLYWDCISAIKKIEENI